MFRCQGPFVSICSAGLNPHAPPSPPPPPLVPTCSRPATSLHPVAVARQLTSGPRDHHDHVRHVRWRPVASPPQPAQGRPTVHVRLVQRVQRLRARDSHATLPPAAARPESEVMARVPRVRVPPTPASTPAPPPPDDGHPPPAPTTPTPAVRGHRAPPPPAPSLQVHRDSRPAVVTRHDVRPVQHRHVAAVAPAAAARRVRAPDAHRVDEDVVAHARQPGRQVHAHAQVRDRVRVA